MKRLLTLFLVIGVLGVYGQSTEGDIKQQADTIIQADTISTENLQIEGDTTSSIKDSLLTEEIKTNQQEIIEKKDSSISCCCLGGKKEQRKSNLSIGYTLGVYPRILWAFYGGEELRGATDGLYVYGNWVCLFHGIEINHNLNLIKSLPLKLGYSYEYSNSFDIVNLLHVSDFNSDYEISHYHGLNLFTFHSFGINMYKESGCFRMGLSNGITYMKQEFYAVYLGDNEWYSIDVNRLHYQIGINAGIDYRVSDHVRLSFGIEYKKYFQIKSYVNYPNIIYEVSKINPGMIMHSTTLSYIF